MCRKPGLDLGEWPVPLRACLVHVGIPFERGGTGKIEAVIISIVRNGVCGGLHVSAENVEARSQHSGWTRVHGVTAHDAVAAPPPTRTSARP
eukprot:6968671-Prymnesium_polylepis.1